MARGYPAPKERPPEIGELVPAGTCPICKRRPIAEGGTLCESCGKALGRA